MVRTPRLSPSCAFLRIPAVLVSLAFSGAPAVAATVSFDEFPPANSEARTLGEQYAGMGVHFTTSGDGAVWAGSSLGDPGNWGVEGTNGSAFVGFDGPSYAAVVRFDAPVTGFAVDVARANGSRFGDRFELVGLRGNVLVERLDVRLGLIDEWITVALSEEVDSVVWIGRGFSAHPFAVDNMHWVGEGGQETVLEVAVDVKPGSDANRLRLSGRGVVPVALLGSEGLDVEEVDPESLVFGPPGPDAPGAAPSHRGCPHLEDVDGDGDADLVVHFRVDETGLGLGDESGCLRGALGDGTPFAGCDPVSVTSR